jgi:hypothetical protein
MRVIRGAGARQRASESGRRKELGRERETQCYDYSIADLDLGLLHDKVLAFIYFVHMSSV